MTTLATDTITIKGRPYGLVVIDGGPHESHSHVYRVQSPAGNVYDVARGFDGLIECTCGDAVWRRNGLTAVPCKHGQALMDAGYFDRPPIDHPDPEPRNDEDEGPDDEDRIWHAAQNSSEYSDDDRDPWDLIGYTESAFDYHARLINEGRPAR